MGSRIRSREAKADVVILNDITDGNLNTNYFLAARVINMRSGYRARGSPRERWAETINDILNKHG